MAALVALAGLSACGTGERPFRMVQFCLADPDEINVMKNVLRTVASANRLSFYDGSAEAEANLDAIRNVQKDLPVARPTVNVGATGRDGMGFSATNFPEAPSQIVVGFSAADDPAAARNLSDAVVVALARRWRIHDVPNVATSGAFPLPDCGG